MSEKKVTCDRATAEEKRTGRTTGRIKLHRWRRPVKVGDRCYCGERVADAIIAKVLD